MPVTCRCDMLLLNPKTYRRLLRPLLFRLPPETAQKAADLALGLDHFWRAVAPALATADERISTILAGIPLDSPVGLAAGYDKNCNYLSSLSSLGFGYVIGGTVTLRPRTGNPKPRMFRYIPHESLVNALGFPGQGLDHAEAKLKRAQRSDLRSPVLVSVSGTEVNEILTCHARLEPLAAGVEVNISSPNTEGLRVFQERLTLKHLLDRINEQRRKPLFIKLPPYLSTPTVGLPESRLDRDESQTEARRNVFELVDACIDAGVDGITVSNTRPVVDPRLAVGEGGLSGRAIFYDTLLMVTELRSYMGSRMPINACGGIFTGQDAWTVLKAGATTVQLLTGLIYRGPAVASSINRELCQQMIRDGFAALPLHEGPASE